MHPPPPGLRTLRTLRDRRDQARDGHTSARSGIRVPENAQAPSRRTRFLMQETIGNVAEKGEGGNCERWLTPLGKLRFIMILLCGTQRWAHREPGDTGSTFLALFGGSRPLLSLGSILAIFGQKRSFCYFLDILGWEPRLPSQKTWSGQIFGYFGLGAYGLPVQICFISGWEPPDQIF